LEKKEVTMKANMDENGKNVLSYSPMVAGQPMKTNNPAYEEWLKAGGKDNKGNKVAAPEEFIPINPVSVELGQAWIESKKSAALLQGRVTIAYTPDDDTRSLADMKQMKEVAEGRVTLKQANDDRLEEKQKNMLTHKQVSEFAKKFEIPYQQKEPEVKDDVRAKLGMVNPDDMRKTISSQKADEAKYRETILLPQIEIADEIDKYKKAVSSGNGQQAKIAYERVGKLQEEIKDATVWFQRRKPEFMDSDRRKEIDAAPLKADTEEIKKARLRRGMNYSTLTELGQ
jgi:hypothetical protein